MRFTATPNPDDTVTLTRHVYTIRMTMRRQDKHDHQQHGPLDSREHMLLTRSLVALVRVVCKIAIELPPRLVFVLVADCNAALPLSKPANQISLYIRSITKIGGPS